MRLVQITNESNGRKVALVEEPVLRIISGFESVHMLAAQAINNNGDLSALVMQNLSSTNLEYDAIYEGNSNWRLLPSFDHPTDPLSLMLSGTGLTHKASAENRQKMHEAQLQSELTDSMKMYMMGVKGGHPADGEIGVQPEWFYKGNGTVLKAHGENLEIPYYGNGGGEEPEIAGVYLNDSQGKPWRIGFTTANEFSDHIMERKNYLYLAPSKIRNCAIGPELVIASEFQDISGMVSIFRKEKVLWKRSIHTGENHMAHSLANLEYHHFKYANHAVPGQAHIHFFGADAFSFGEQIAMDAEDIMEVSWDEMGRPLRNRLVSNHQNQPAVQISSLF
jgi:hypothetical protein